MWTYLLLCCLAAATVFSSDSSPASNSTISNSSIGATSDHLATGLKSYTDNFPKPACIVSVTNGSYSPFSGGSYPLQGFETVMLQALCPCCQYDRNQVLILVSNSPVLESAKDLLITLDAEHVFKICSPRYRRRESDNYFTLRHNNKMIDLKRKQSVTVRDSNKKILADLKISGSGQRVEYIEAQFPQHNITVGWAPEEVILVHLDPFISQRKALRGYCVGPDA